MIKKIAKGVWNTVVLSGWILGGCALIYSGFKAILTDAAEK